MKPVSATDILRKSAPRDFLGQSFAHRNRFEVFRDPSPNPSIRNRLGSSASTKRKGNDMYEGDSCEEVPPKRSNYSSWYEETVQDNQVTVSLTEEEEVSLACIDSNIAKVGGQCNKMVEALQRLHLEEPLEPLRTILGELIEAVQTTNKVQEGLSAGVRTNTTLSKKVNMTYGNVAAAPPLPPLLQRQNKQVSKVLKTTAGKNCLAGCLPLRQTTEVSSPDQVALW
jgi:hypothetical protein